MGKLTLAAALAACAAVEIASADAAVLVVFKSIQAAVNEAQPGDTIFVPPGTYRETVRVLKNNITIVGSEGRSSTRAALPTGSMSVPISLAWDHTAFRSARRQRSRTLP